jgi:anti-anti-sigma regulatory factor
MESHLYAIRFVDLSELSFVDRAGMRVLANAISVLDDRRAVLIVDLRAIVRRPARRVALD